MSEPAPEPAEPTAPRERPARAADATAAVGFEVRARLGFPVVGVGASAGGLRALRAMVEGLPADGGMAYVIVQHLPADRDSLLASILSRSTSMPVLDIADGMEIRPDHVYVTRPSHATLIEDGRLRLGAPVLAQGRRCPIDDLFRSLAAEQHERAIAVVLSGMGSNGTAGAQAVKAAGGACFAQQPEEADYRDMPASLIRAGYADQVLRAAEIGAVLARYARHPYVDPGPHDGGTWALLDDDRHFRELLALLRTRTRHDFSGYKKPTVLRRAQRRMGLHGIDSLREYAALMRAEPEEAVSLANDLLISVTGFFRDAPAWDTLQETVVRPLVASKPPDGTIRAWVTACSSGEEAYTLAIVIAEELERAGRHLEVKIFATDAADRSLALARAGLYPDGIEADLGQRRLERFFVRDQDAWRIRKEIREMVVFASQDLLADPPFSRIDLCTCRNLLIYLEPETQARVMALLHFALRDGGVLFLGNAETLGAAEPLFEVVDKPMRIFRRAGASGAPAIERALPPAPSAVPRTSAPAVVPQPTRAVAIPGIQRALLDAFGPPTVVIDLHERVLYFHGDTAPFLQLSGEPTRSLLDLVRPALRPLVRTALRQGAAERGAITLAGPRLETPDGAVRTHVTVAPLAVVQPGDHLRVSFELRPDTVAEAAGEGVRDAATPALRPADEAHEEELHSVRLELQHAVEAFEASNEELKAANEEVMSINEELQSANEELETSKEELQSLNEELSTVNAQLQEKVAELEAVTDDLSNLLSSTDIAVLFLGTDLRVRRFTPAMADLLELIPSDIGRPVVHLARKFEGSELVADARQVLDRLVPLESEVRSHSGRWYLERALPYRTADNRIDGVVVAFVDISARKVAELSVAQVQARLRAVVEQMPAAVLVVEAPGGNLEFGNRRAADLLGVPYPMPSVGTHWAAAFVDLEGARVEERREAGRSWPIARSLQSGATVSDEEIEVRHRDGSVQCLVCSATPVRDAEGRVSAVVSTFWDVTARRRAEQALRDSEERLRLVMDNIGEHAIFMLDPDGRIASWNDSSRRVLGWTDAEALGAPFGIVFTAADREAGAPQSELAQAREQGSLVEERTHVRRDGTEFWAIGALTAVRDPAGTPRGFIKILRDDGERRRQQLQLQVALRQSEEMRALAERTARAKDDFVSVVSHELRTPLNTIGLWLRLLGSDKVSPQERAAGTEAIGRAVTAQRRLIDDLLDTSRMASGTLRLSLANVRLSETIEEAVETVRPFALERGVSIEAAFDPAVGVVRVDAGRIRQVVWNLLTNAVKFTPAGGHVRVETRRSDGTVEIAVADTGIGIRPDFLPFVFDRFRQADSGPSRPYAGLGLGLAIARQLVELHRGRIDVESAGEGRGTTVTVRLPLRPRREAGRRLPSPAVPQTLGGIDVLLVEDDPRAREATRLLLERGGARVRAVESVQGALREIEARRPQAILADIAMPEKDGYVLARTVREQEQARGEARLPMVALTAFAGAEHRERALAAGFDEHFAKPLDFERLVRWIGSVASPD